MQELLDELSRVLGRGVSVDDVAGRVVAHSAQTDDVDQARVRAILARRVPADVAAWQEQHGLATATGPVRVPGNAALGFGQRVGFPLRHNGVLVGYLWVLGDVPELDLGERLAALAAQVPVGDRTPVRVVVALEPRVVRTVPAAEALPDLPGHVGVSDPHPPDRTAAAYQQALAAAELARLDPALPDRVRWSELGAYRLLLGASPDEVVAGLSDVLLRTLEVYLDCGCEVRAAAERLHLHRTSLYYRLGRIAELTGRDLADGGARLELHLALKLVRLARRQ
ncbi:helix-turn-helix domain-containing protein [Saccharothrix luteola]|uniref:helix-turn-helix domain-containing protein n=1 Tax=Saccharothrix luteola TaxID=2893018 RepID=UPI001E54790F|nr:helix-turn-helix domain-containing protein [Saccharothrix luteola]MCC8245923.1 helix-turn-helix domain-containing protein [Saccharothrix luteola]MCC8248317.1 helix-turn-helix domain-containing protein [Saccharothrix luteola]